MTEVLLLSFAAACLGVLAWGFSRPSRLLQYPTLAAAVFAGQLIPQFYGARSVQFLDASWIQTALIMATLCVGACLAGYANVPGASRCFKFELDSDRLLIGCWCLALIGIAFRIALSRLDADLLAPGQWTGTPTILHFFSRTMECAVGIACIAYYRRRDPRFLWPLALSVVFMMDDIIFYGKRSSIAFVILVWASTRWVVLKKTPSRMSVIAVLVTGALVVNSITVYRQAIKHEAGLRSGLLGTTSLDFKELTFEKFRDGFLETATAKPHEALCCCLVVGIADTSGHYDLGATYWNALVFSFVPGQFVGADFKASLMIESPIAVANSRLWQFKRYYVGSASTGIADSYSAFWFFGALVFFAIARFMRRLHDSAIFGIEPAQILYVIMVVPSLWAVAHGTTMFLARLVYVGIFVGTVLLWAKKSSNTLATNTRKKPGASHGATLIDSGPKHRKPSL